MVFDETRIGKLAKCIVHLPTPCPSVVQRHPTNRSIAPTGNNVSPLKPVCTPMALRLHSILYALYTTKQYELQAAASHHRNRVLTKFHSPTAHFSKASRSSRTIFQTLRTPVKVYLSTVYAHVSWLAPGIHLSLTPPGSTKLLPDSFVRGTGSRAGTFHTNLL